MPSLPHILVVDDDSRIRSMLRRYLSDEGFKVSELESGAALMQVMQGQDIDLVLLDLMIPGEDGLSLARTIRRISQVPIIMLTGKGDVIDRVAGLEAGADDYVTKPFHLRELLARIRTVMRRASPTGAPQTLDGVPQGRGEIFEFEGWRLDVERRQLQREGEAPASLTSGEFDLLSVFVRNAGRVLHRDSLMDLVKGRDWAAFDRAIDTQVARLRRKIEADSGEPKLIKTVRGAGYVFAGKVRKG